MSASRPDNLRDDPGYWLAGLIALLFPPIWLIGLGWLIWNIPEIRREYRQKRECKERGHHLWGEYHDHPYFDIAHQFCQHCHCANWDARLTP